MNKRTVVVLPRLQKILEEVGENIKLARLRRKLTGDQVAERAGITRKTLWLIEKGAPTVSLGGYAQVLFVLGMEKELLKMATNDDLGRKLQDAELITGKRAPKKK
jgi:transcriptional regulator with XRE-family HTH domain